MGRTLPIWNTWGRVEPFSPDAPWLLRIFDQVRLSICLGSFAFGWNTKGGGVMWERGQGRGLEGCAVCQEATGLCSCLKPNMSLRIGPFCVPSVAGNRSETVGTALHNYSRADTCLIDIQI